LLCGVVEVPTPSLSPVVQVAMSPGAPGASAACAAAGSASSAATASADAHPLPAMTWPVPRAACSNRHAFM
jgi:hypothetical protein